MPKYILILYHGTNDIASKSIMENGFRIPSFSRNDHWLGNGVYFFREDCEQAFMWGRSKFLRDKGTKEIHVIRAHIEIEEENYLNLDTRNGMNKLRRFLRDFRKLLSNYSINLDEVSEEELRCFIMDLLPSEYNAVQRTFPVESKVFDNDIYFRKMNLYLQGTQVCFRVEEAIKGNIELATTEALTYA